MSTSMTTKTLLTDAGEFTVEADGLWIAAADMARATGWTLKPEGLCRGDICVPLTNKEARGEKVDLGAFWDKLRAPLVSDASGTVVALGTAAEDRNAELEGLAAPDFTLPDLNGKEHTLSQLKGRKVFLSTWASW